MKKSKIKEILQALFDAPLSSRNLLVDRKEEINFLNTICSFQPLGVYGVCGETGVGKTTLLNFLDPGEGKRIYLKLTEKENKEVIIGDMLYKLAKEVEKYEKPELSKIAKESIEFVIEERNITNSVGAGGGVIVSGNFSKSTTRIKKFNIYQAYDLLDSILNLLLKKYKRIVLIIDELDKEKKEEVLMILDSLKSIFDKNNLVVILSLPFAIYREYTKDRLRWNESGNLENILKDVLFLEPLSDRQIQEMIMKRLEKYPDFFDSDTLYEIAKYSDGNPRDALWISQQIVLDNLDLERITGKSATETLKKITKKYFESSLDLTEIQEKVLNVIAKYSGSRNELVKKLEKEGIKRQTAYTYINRLKENGLILERNGKLKVSGKILYIISN
ncbi:ATPase [Thermosipho ferrireducens]|uniref:ATPase n=1 Tax=Thermosipho ferrireducens TaxID=2571116 RepID=A0ABX7S933_9BACT|nr:P-loop NTPase fold protein [Thermosipho ferrireducens]QTA38468.1 ATPase [Thermosipho ferrireducens]